MLKIDRCKDVENPGCAEWVSLTKERPKIMEHQKQMFCKKTLVSATRLVLALHEDHHGY